MPSEGFEPATPATKQPLDRAATEVGTDGLIHVLRSVRCEEEARNFRVLHHFNLPATVLCSSAIKETLLQLRTVCFITTQSPRSKSHTFRCYGSYETATHFYGNVRTVEWNHTSQLRRRFHFRMLISLPINVVMFSLLQRSHDTSIFHTSASPPSVVVEWLTFLLRIQEVTGSYLDTDIGCPDWG
jgi:hypothetical protein